MGIAVFGSVFVDIKGHPFTAYIPAGRNAGRVEEVHGGVSRNTAEDIANIGLSPLFVGLVDESGAGLAVRRRLEKHKCSTEFMETRPDGMGTWLAVFDETGDLVAAISQRPDLSPIADILDERGDELFQKTDSVVIETDINDFIVERVLKLAGKYGVPVYGVVSNMTIALERRHYLRFFDCFVCNEQEAGILFGEDYTGVNPDKLADMLLQRIQGAGIPRMVVTMGAEGAVWADKRGTCGTVPAVPTDVKDTAGAGDAFMAGVASGLTYGKTLAESCTIGAKLASSVICTDENVCPRFLPGEFGIELGENGLPVKDFERLAETFCEE